MRPNNRRGLSLGTTILIMTLVATLVFALASTSVTHLRLSHQRSNSQVAENKARSLVNRALAKVLEEPEFGKQQEKFPTPTTPEAFLTFAPSGKEPYSLNNLEGEGTRLGWDSRPVPPQALHLVAGAKVGNSTRIAEALYTIPSFPYAVASNSSIRSTGSLVVGGVSSLGENREFSPADLLPADLASNANGDQAILLSPGSYVAGDVTAVGSIQLTEGVTVEGEVRGGGERVTLPRLDITRYDPASEPSTLFLQGLTSGSFPRTIDGLVRYDGDINLRGPLELDNGLLYVDGDLRLSLNSALQGGIRGYGAIIVTGETHIHGASDFSQLNGVALLSRGDIELKGSSQESAFFQGLVYSEGSVKAEKLTVLGGMISSSDDPSDTVTLVNAKAIHVPELQVINITDPPDWSFRTQDNSEYLNGGNEGQDLTRDEHTEPREGLLSVTSDYRIAVDKSTGNLQLIAKGKITTRFKMKTLKRASTDESEDPEDGGERLITFRIGGLTEVRQGRDELPPGHQLETRLETKVLPEFRELEETVIDLPVNLDQLRNRQDALVGLVVPVPSVSGATSSSLQVSEQDSNSESSAMGQQISRSTTTLDQEQARALRKRILEVVEGSSKPGRFKFDPNQFLSLADKIRLQYFRVH